MLSNNECVLNPVQYIIGENDEECYALVIAESLAEVVVASTAKYTPEEHEIKKPHSFANKKRSHCKCSNFIVFSNVTPVIHKGVGISGKLGEV